MRVGIADGSSYMLSCLSGRVRSMGWNVVWTAKNGFEAADFARKIRTELVVLGLNMPLLDGIQACLKIREFSGLPIIVFGKSMDSQTLCGIFSSGATDAVEIASASDEVGIEVLLGKMDRLYALRRGEKISYADGMGISRCDSPHPPIFAVGASTGGPQALIEILAGLDEDFPAAVIVAQHMNPEFSDGFVDWLAKACKIKVKLAEDGERPSGGVVYIAGLRQDLEIGKDLGFSLREPLEGSVNVPNIDRMFLSMAVACKKKHFGGGNLALILSGMGRDGAEGLLALRKAGWTTAAQGEKSSTAYSMPKAALQVGACSVVMELDRLPLFVKNFFG